MTLMQSFHLALFMALLLAVSMLALTASGHFPKEHRSPSLNSAMGGLILFGSIALALVCLVLGIFFVQMSVPWYAAVIGGGIMVLATPLLLRPFPDSFVNGRASLLTFSALAVGFSCAMAFLGD
jgi:hypothetical protein